MKVAGGTDGGALFAIDAAVFLPVDHALIGGIDASRQDPVG